MFRARNVAEISRQLNGAFKAELIGSNPYVWPNNLAINRKVLAQAFRGYELLLERLHKQRFASYADDEYLDLHAAEEGLARIPAQYAAGIVDVITVAGTLIPAGTQMTHEEQTYETLADITATTTLTKVNVQATEAGVEGNLDPGAELTIVEAISGVGSIIVASTDYEGQEIGGIVGGEDRESNDSLRERILFAKRNPPVGGSPGEYIKWSKEKPGVTRVWVKRATPQAGSVTIYFAMDNTYTNGIPTASEVADLQAILEEQSPGYADVIVAAPTTLVIPVEITNLTPDSPAIREGVAQELAAVFLRRAEPGEIFARDWLSEGIASVPGWRRHRITSPAGDTTPTTGQLPVLGAITFV